MSASWQSRMGFYAMLMFHLDALPFDVDLSDERPEPILPVSSSPPGRVLQVQ